MEGTFKCANTSLSGLLVRNDFRNLLQSVAPSGASVYNETEYMMEQMKRRYDLWQW